jgi:two-component system, LytTR family, response regulator
MTLRAILIDDEDLAIGNLTSLLKQHCPQVQIVAAFSDSTEGLHGIRQHKPDLVFLDIQMPRLDGFQVLERVEDLSFAVVFVTGHGEFALKAFRYSAVDYLLKPIVTKELVESVEKARKRQPVLDGQLAHLRSQFDHPGHAPDTMILPSLNGNVFVAVCDILYCAANDNYTIFHVADGQQYLRTKPLKYVEELLDGHDFLRVHKTYLVNRAHIKRFVRGENSHVLLTNDQAISVSRSYKDRIIERFGWL